MGQRRIPIILVEFHDKKFNNSRQDIIDAMLTGDESVGQYFRDQSNGLYEPEFEVFGIYPLSQDRSYYGGNSNGTDQALGAMVTEACQMAAADGVSFAPYDTNSDDFCDVVIVIYAGVGESQAYATYPEAIWPCNWTLDAAAYYDCGGDGAFRPGNGDPYVNTFAVFNELYGSNDDGNTIDGIGTFAHEFGHCLGLPDFYDTGSAGHYGMGDWDIMCMGCYNNDGFTPPGYTAYEKVFMGWVNYIKPQPGNYYTLPVWNQKQQSTDKAVCIVSDLNENEYFILENRKRQGWDRYMPGEGIMITHVTYNADRWWANTPNNQNIQLMTIMPADNTLSYYNEGTDLWPQSGKTEFTDSSTPAARLNMRANGSISGNAGYLGKPVTDMVINNDGTASFWYMKGAVVDPVIMATVTDVDFGSVMMNYGATMTVKVFGQALTGDVTLTIEDANGVFGVDPEFISKADASNGVDVTLTFAPAGLQDYTATITLVSEGAEDVVINLSGRGVVEGYAPVMLPADEQYINLTQFRADWTDITPEADVASYTLEVMTKPAIALLEDADFSLVPDAVSDNSLADITANTDGYLPQGWSATSFLGAYGGALVMAYDGTITTPTYNFAGYDKVSVVIKAAAYYYDNSTISVSSSMGTQELSLTGNMTDYMVVLDCGDNDAVTVKSLNNYSNIRQVTVYAGDVTTAMTRLAEPEQGDATYRLITGITDKFYTVRGLEAAGTYIYKVKSIFIDGTESAWSNVEVVTLFESGHGYQPGDVNHDGKLSIADVTNLINMLLSGSTNDSCPICADVNEDSRLTIADVTDLINLLLSGN